MHRMHTESDRDNATFARLNLFPERKEESVVWTRHSDRAYATFAATTIFSVYSYLSGNKRNILGGTD